MKKISLIILAVLLLSGCTKKEVTPDREAEIYTIELSEIITKIENKDSFLLVVSQTFCGYCHEYKEYLNENRDKLFYDVYIIEYDILSNEDKATLREIVEFTKTPTSYGYVEGKLNKQQVGIIDVDKIAKLFK